MEHQFCHPFVSIIIPVFNHAEQLKTCLKSLANQTYPKHFYEIVVVDNGSDKDEDIAGIVTQFGQAIATYESTPGSYAARNKGISLAKGEVIAFTDADCIPSANWIENGVQNLLQTPNCGLVIGKIEIFFKNPNQITPVELYESITAFPQKELLEKYKGGATANVFTFRSVIEQVGLFNARMKSNGDLEWGQRVYAAGYKQIYADDTCVAHPARSSFAELYKRTVRLAGGIYDLHSQKEASYWQRNKVFIKTLAQNLIPPINFVVNTIRDSRLKGVEQKIKVSLVMFFVRYISAWEMIRLKFGGETARI
ncbi:glycosyltransferase [Chroococcidiopsis sp. CCMEE 29]|uniref:glycosyltransferase n=1 Tax=Chroococcidiopsis sp. CCMEE 29 TaxID=155894 RepID=UPI002021797B|nr:glycosyltransferase [Chroococcidiopsis sp. CCMEE 29]